jgi:hypothetical protein
MGFLPGAPGVPTSSLLKARTLMKPSLFPSRRREFFSFSFSFFRMLATALVAARRDTHEVLCGRDHTVPLISLL